MFHLIVDTAGEVSSSPFFTSKLATKKTPTSSNFLLSLGVICFEGPKHSSLQIPSFPNKLLTEAGNQHEWDQTHHHCAWDDHHRQQKTQNPWLSFLAQKTREGKITFKSIRQKVTRHLPSLSSFPQLLEIQQQWQYRSKNKDFIYRISCKWSIITITLTS